MIELKRQRVLKEWTQRRLAQESGISQNYIAFAETRGFIPYPSQQKKLAAALGWAGNPEDLFANVEPK